MPLTASPVTYAPITGLLRNEAPMKSPQPSPMPPDCTPRRQVVVPPPTRRFEVAVLGRAPGDREQEHLHARRRAVGGRPEVRVVRAAAVLDVDVDRVVLRAAPAEVVGLEVPGRLGEAEQVRPIVEVVG